jgi:hypothetical protein
LNGVGFEPGSSEEVPDELRTTKAEHGRFHWQILSGVHNAWVELLQSRLPQILPRSFRSKIERNRFCCVTVGPLMFFANTGHEVFYELSDRMFRDKPLSPMLLQNGYLQFGNPFECNYDPICFDMNRRHREDAPIIQLDHEEILINNRISVTQEIAPSFQHFMQRAIEEKFPVS